MKSFARTLRASSLVAVLGLTAVGAELHGSPAIAAYPIEHGGTSSGKCKINGPATVKHHAKYKGLTVYEFTITNTGNTKFNDNWWAVTKNWVDAPGGPGGAGGADVRWIKPGKTLKQRTSLRTPKKKGVATLKIIHKSPAFSCTKTIKVI